MKILDVCCGSRMFWYVRKYGLLQRSCDYELI